MEDFNAYLYNEIRHLAFRKSSEQVTWQDAIKQQRETDIENRLCKIASDNSLAGFTKALAGQFSQWRQHRQASAMISNFPSQPKAE